MMDLLTRDATRWEIAAAIVAVFVAVCLWAALRRRPAVAEAPPAQAIEGGGTDRRPDMLVVYASQTGQAEDIARRSAASLTAGGRTVQILSLADVTPQWLAAVPRLLCVAATAGEGEAPDEVRRFVKTVMATRLDLSHLGFAVLALGDRTHGHFCAFGHRLDDWLSACGAAPLRGCLEVDDLNAAALGDWDGFVQRLGGARTAAPVADAMSAWQLRAREILNPDSKAQKLVQVDLELAGDLPAWQAGDLAEIVTPRGHRRDYSIASLPHEGHVRLLVRQTPHGDGSTLLTETLALGATMPMRVKSHGNFHTPEGKGALLLVGAGSGLAGLRAHILAARAAGRKAWLIYGERNPVTDGVLCDELIGWQDDGSLRLDLAFSSVKDGQGRYVQDIMVGRTNELKTWLGTDGAVLVCGGLDMGKAVDATLRSHLGDAWADEAIAVGRYRRDLY